MTNGSRQESSSAAMWSDAATASSWIAGDALETMLSLPRSLTMSIVARDRGDVRSVIDVASGPGGFLEVALDRFPEAEGIWFDVSETMRDAAEERLSRFAGRVRFVLGDMASLGSADLPTGVDLLLSSRATHHLLPEELKVFYKSAVALVGAGGWVANLDHVGIEDHWDARLREARDEFRPREPREGSHHHDHGRPTLEEHLAALRACGVGDIDTPWRAFYTVLVAARKAG